MKELNHNASAFLKQLTTKLVVAIRECATGDTIICFDTKSMMDDEYGTPLAAEEISNVVQPEPSA